MYLVSLPGWTMTVFIIVYIVLLFICLWNIYVRTNQLWIKILLALSIILFPPFMPLYFFHLLYTFFIQKKGGLAQTS